MWSKSLDNLSRNPDDCGILRLSVGLHMPCQGVDFCTWYKINSTNHLNEGWNSDWLSRTGQLSNTDDLAGGTEGRGWKGASFWILKRATPITTSTRTPSTAVPVTKGEVLLAAAGKETKERIKNELLLRVKQSLHVSRLGHTVQVLYCMSYRYIQTLRYSIPRWTDRSSASFGRFLNRPTIRKLFQAVVEAP